MDWQVTTIFYTALHAIDAAMSHLGIKVSDHETRNSAVRNNGSFAGLRDAYIDLYRISKVTRYNADADQWLPDDYLTVNDLVDHLLRPIEREVERLVGRKLDGAISLKT